MEVILLGTAAGGGFPQWNCWCPTCRVAREAPERAHPRTQSSVAVSADGVRWFLCNASPDVREQLGRLTRDPGAAMRHVPLEGLVLTDAELDHTVGVALLREGRDLAVYCTPAVERILTEDSAILAVTRAFASVRVTPLALDAAVPLVGAGGTPSGLTVEAFAVAGDPPRFASADEAGHTVGLVIRDAAGATFAYLPGCGALDDALLARLAASDLVVIDGTFWSEDELVRLGLSDRVARQMGHQPVGGPDGTLARLRALTADTTVVYAHINNSNPVLVEDAPERREVAAASCVVGDDGMRFTVSAGRRATATRP
jgi:pyrroloquinoline quinone biosynthesis protein B